MTPEGIQLVRIIWWFVNLVYFFYNFYNVFLSLTWFIRSFNVPQTVRRMPLYVIPAPQAN